ncbi:MAG: transposase [Chloroflexi bacterium]|nr:transposase [Chloroflexota bacterium]
MALGEFTYRPGRGQYLDAENVGLLGHVLAFGDDDALLERLQAYRHTGRPGYPVSTMWRAFQIKYLLGIRFNRDLIAQLQTSPALRSVCGFGDVIPHESAFSRFFARLANHQQEIESIQTRLVEWIADEIERQKKAGTIRDDSPPLGEVTAIDSTDLPSHASIRRKPHTDPSARWGHRTPKFSLSANELFLGYKLHSVVDVNYGVPLVDFMLPANESDSPQLPKLVELLKDTYPWMEPRCVVADRGYDATSNYVFLENQKLFSVILRRNTDRDGDIYTLDGRPRCVGGEPMQFVHTDPHHGHLFRCNPDGCELKGKSPWLGPSCVSEHHEVPAGDPELLRKVGRLPRASEFWGWIYRRRQSIERLFNSLKHSRLLTTHRYLRRRKVRLHASLSVLTSLMTMLGRLTTGDYARMRWMRLTMSTVAQMPTMRAA